MDDGYWVVSVERSTGRATSELFTDHDEAYRHALATQTPDVCKTVIARKQFATNRTLVNRC